MIAAAQVNQWKTDVVGMGSMAEQSCQLSREVLHWPKKEAPMKFAGVVVDD
jgi:hypothetical protein